MLWLCDMAHFHFATLRFEMSLRFSPQDIKINIDVIYTYKDVQQEGKWVFPALSPK
jgi:hypothetical protein